MLESLGGKASTDSQTLRRDSCWYSGYLKSKYLTRKRKEEKKKSIKKKKKKKEFCCFVQLYQFTAFLHLPWKLARQCTVNVKHCRLVTASLCFYKFQSQRWDFFFFFPFSSYFSQRAETKLFLMWRSCAPERIWALACLALHVPLARLREVLGSKRIAWCEMPINGRWNCYY